MVAIVVLLDLSIRIVVVIASGAAIGLERPWRLRTADIRTNAMVSVGAPLFAIVGSVSLKGNQAMDVVADPTRGTAEVVTGRSCGR